MAALKKSLRACQPGKRKSLMNLSLEIDVVLIFAIKSPEKPIRGRTSKRASLECSTTVDKRPSDSLPGWGKIVYGVEILNN